jgi:hypothetical protein
MVVNFENESELAQIKDFDLFLRAHKELEALVRTMGGKTTEFSNDFVLNLKDGTLSTNVYLKLQASSLSGYFKRQEESK